MKRPVLTLAIVLASSPARADGPGLGNLSYAESEVFKQIARIDGSIGAPRAHGTVHMHRGYLAVVYAPDSGKSLGGFSFYDVSNPRAPKLAKQKDDAETHPMREGHGWGFAGDLAFLQSNHGFLVWDWADPLSPKRVGEATLPGITESDYNTGAWWLAVQAPYVYVAGSANGLYIVDVSDPKNPKLADRGGKPNPIPASQLGGFRSAVVFAIGNLLVVTSNDDAGYTTLDIGDPLQPKLLKTKKIGMPSAYSSFVNGNRIYGLGNDKKIFVHDIANPSLMSLLGSTPEAGDDKGGYVQVQDGFAHAGMGTTYAKFDLRNKDAFTLVGTGTSGIKGRDEDFANPLGNLVLVGSDHGDGTTIMPHQAAPDTTPPEVNMVVPKAGATRQVPTTRVGVTFTDAIDTGTLTTANFVVRKVGGSPLSGRLSYGMMIANFAPDAPLEIDTTYEVVVSGLKDVAGNVMAKPFVSTFSTGVGGAAGCAIEGAGPSLVSKAASFKAKAVGTGLTYTWDFGDGSASPPPSTSPEVSFAWKDPGHYTVTLSVSGKDLETSCSVLQTVTHPLLSSPPTRSSTLAIDESRKRVWVVNPDANTVAAVGLDSLVKELEVPVGKHPATVAVAPDGSVWVTNEDDASVSVLDGQKVVATIGLPQGSRPHGVAFGADGFGYVSLGAVGKLAKLDAKSRAVVATLVVGPWPRGVAVSAEHILVTRFLSDRDIAEVTDVDAASFTVKTTIELPFDKGPDSESSGRGVLNYLSGVTISPDGRRAFVPGKKDNIVRGTRRDGKPLTFESSVRTSMAQLDLLKGEEDLVARIDFNDRSLAQDVVLSKLGDVAFVVTTGTNTVEALDPFSGQILTSIEKVGAAPRGVALDPAGTRLFVQAFVGRELTVWDVRGIVDFSDNQFKKLATVKTVDVEPLPPNVLLGKKIFYDASDERMGKDKYLSCAVCHLDGGDDGRVWDFTDRGEGFRNTTSLLGRRGVGHGRMHWSANFDEVQDFEGDIRNAFFGQGFLTDGQWKTHGQSLGPAKAGLSPELDALAAYVTSLDKVHASPHRKQDGGLTDDGLRGLKVFRQKGCPKCHGGPDLTDSATGELHDVGTLKPESGKRLGGPLTGLDSPTLRGIWETAPYLHDGSAATLEEVLTVQDPTGKHIGPLSDDERRWLVAYLSQIDHHDDEGVDPDALLDEGGCGCRTGARGQTGWLGLWVALLAIGRRRTRKKSRPMA